MHWWSHFDVQLRGTRNDQMPVGGRTQIAIALTSLIWMYARRLRHGLAPGKPGPHK